MSNVEKILPHIATIYDVDVPRLDKTTDNQPVRDAMAVLALKEWTIRMAARCVVVDPKTKRIALQALDTENVIKIPGGGLQHQPGSAEDEGFEKGVIREIAEEIGVDANNMNLHLLGMVTEYREQWKLQQISYCYVGNIGDGELYQEPMEEGSRLVWADTPAHAIDLVQGYPIDTYDKGFMSTRDTAILEFYQSAEAAKN